MSYTTKKFKTDLAPTGYLTYRYYLPPGFGEENKFSKKLPLLLCLHGGGGNETYCDNVSKTIFSTKNDIEGSYVRQWQYIKKMLSF